MTLTAFLLNYLKRYSLWGALSVLSIGLFAVTSAAMLALIAPVFEQVLPTSQMSAEELGAFRSFGVRGAGDTTTDGTNAVARTESEGSPDDQSALATSRNANSGIDTDRSDGSDSILPFSAQLDSLRENAHARFRELYASLQTALGVSSSNRLWRPEYFAPILFLLVFTARSMSSFAGAYTFQRIGFGATTDIRNDLYDYLLNQSSAFHSDNPSGKLFSRVINDVSRLQNAFTTGLVDLFQQSIMLVVCLVALVLIHPRMAFICLIAMPLIIYPVIRFGRGMFRTSHRSQERMEDLAELLTEGIRGNRVVKAFGMEEFEGRRVRNATRRHLAVNLRAQMLSAASSPVIETLAALGGCTLLIGAGRMINQGELTPATFMAFLAVLLMLYDPIRKLNKVNLVVQEALASADRVASLMRSPISVRDEPTHAPLEKIESGIRFDRVSFSYGDKRVLREFELEVNFGEIVALVGPSGAGKSTVVNLLPRFFDPDRGQILIDGVDIRTLPLVNLRSLIGIVTQDTVLFNDSVRNNIAYGRNDLSLELVREAAAAAYADEFITELEHGYDTVIGESGHQLSGGQRQRLAIARALLKNAPILILDEATSHLDSESESLVQRAVYNLMEGRTALVIAHRLSTVTRADRILVMEDGEVIEEGTHATLLDSGGAYRNLYDIQFRTS